MARTGPFPDPPPPPSGRPEESRALTGLRGLAAGLVVLHHFYLHLAIDRHMPMLQWLLRKGYLGVDLFFVLSGFVITMVYGAWFERGGPARARTYLRFLSRRVARLWPVHATMLVFVLLAGAALGHPPIGANPTPRLVLANFAMIQAWGSSAELNTPAWSVSTELAAYLLFPLLAALTRRGRWGPVLCAAGAAAVLAACVAAAPPLGPARRGWLDLYFNYSPLPLLRCLCGFTFGVLAWRAGGLRPVRRFAALPLAAPLVAAVFIGMMLGRANDLLTVAVIPVLVLVMHLGRGPVQAALGSNPLHGLGLLSYAVYLVHFLLLSLFPFHWAPLRFLLPLYSALTLAAAFLLYRWVEEPGRAAIRRLADRALAPPPLQDRAQ